MRLGELRAPLIAALLLLPIAAQAEQLPDGDVLDELRRDLQFPDAPDLNQRLIALFDQASLAAKRDGMVILASSEVDPRPVMRHLVGDADPQVQQSILVAFGTLGPTSEQDHIAVRSSLGSPISAVARQGLQCLSHWRDLSDAPSLIAVLKSPDAELVTAAQKALHVITGQDLGTDQAAWSSWCQARAESDTKFQALKGQLDSPKDVVVLEAIKNLAFFMDRKSELVGLLEPLAVDRNVRIAQAASELLHRIDPKRYSLVARPVPTGIPVAQAKDMPAAEPYSVPWVGIAIVLVLGACLYAWIQRLLKRFALPTPIQVIRSVGKSGPRGPQPAGNGSTTGPKAPLAGAPAAVPPRKPGSGKMSGLQITP